MNPGRLLARAHRALAPLSHARVVALSILGIVIIGIPDFLVGVDISLSIFYLWPIGIATWYVGRRAGAAVAFISTLVALAGDFAGGHLSSRPGIVVWNGLLHFGFMLVVSYLLDTLRSHIAHEHELANTDALTGVSNRRAFVTRLEYCLDLASRDGASITLAYIDLDDFKLINDSGGHEAGDRLLKLYARTLQGLVRRTDMVARLGGDEFVLLLPGMSPREATRLIGKVRNALARAQLDHGDAVTCSIGCVTFLSPPPDANGAIRAADALMYRIKGQGKNAALVEVADGRPQDSARARTALGPRQRLLEVP